MGIIEEIKQLATTIGTDVKALRHEKADKVDFDKIVTALNGIADGLKGNTTGHTATGETSKENTINDSFAQKVVKRLIEQHYPFLNSEEDNFDKFVEFMKFKSLRINALENKPRVLLDDNGVSILVTPNNGFAVKVKYTSNNKEHEEMVIHDKTIHDVTKFSYRECDYYGNFGDELEKTILLSHYKQQVEHPENYIFSGYDDRVPSNEIAFTSLVDNSNYDILDFCDNNFYVGIATRAVEKIDKNKKLSGEFSRSLTTVHLNGEIKVGIAQSGFVTLGTNAYNRALANPPKYLVYSGDNLEMFNSIRLIGGDYSIDNMYNSQDGFDIWYNRLEQFKRVRSVIYRWDSTKNKYMFEAVSTLEDWLKEHPIDTL